MKSNISFSLVAVAVCMFLFCVNLGIWQLKRLEEKEILLSKLSEKFSFLSVNSSDLFNDSKGLFSYWRWKPVFLVGVCEKKIVMVLQSRSVGGQYGVNLFFPCYLHCGKVVFVNYSWSSLLFRRFDYQIENNCECFFLTVLRFSERSGFFIPYQVPQKHEWYSLDNFIDLEHYFGFSVSSPFFVVFKDNGKILTLYTPVLYNIANNHLIYSFTWFLLLFCMILFYTIYM